jgi:hypothetical protein
MSALMGSIFEHCEPNVLSLKSVFLRSLLDFGLGCNLCS